MARGCTHAPNVCTNWITFSSPGARCTDSQTLGRAQGSLLTATIELSVARCAYRRVSNANQTREHGFLASTILHCTRRVSRRPLPAAYWITCAPSCHLRRHHPYHHRHPPLRLRPCLQRRTQLWRTPSSRLRSPRCPNVADPRQAGSPPRLIGCARSFKRAT